MQSTVSSNFWQTPPSVASDHVESYICRVIHKTFDLLVSNIQLHNCREWLELKLSWRQTFFIHRQPTPRPHYWALSIVSSPELWAEEEWEEEWVDEEPWWGRRRPSVSTEQNILNFTSVLLSPGRLGIHTGDNLGMMLWKVIWFWRGVAGRKPCFKLCYSSGWLYVHICIWMYFWNHNHNQIYHNHHHNFRSRCGSWLPAVPQEEEGRRAGHGGQVPDDHDQHDYHDHDWNIQDHDHDQHDYQDHDHDSYIQDGSSCCNTTYWQIQTSFVFMYFNCMYFCLNSPLT